MTTKSLFDMYYGASPEIQERAKTLRNSKTGAEKRLWNNLKSKQIRGIKFRRQHPISQFIVDFYCHELKLIIEVDGKIHLQSENREYDENRTAELERYGLKFLRFTYDEVENNMKEVLESIEHEITNIQRKVECE